MGPQTKGDGGGRRRRPRRFDLKSLDGEDGIAGEDSEQKGRRCSRSIRSVVRSASLRRHIWSAWQRARAIQVIGISQDDAGSTHGFSERFGVTFPTLLDQRQDGYPASNAYGISSVPSLFLVEPDGRISKSFSGFSKGDLEEVGERAGVAPFGPEDRVPDFKAG